MGLSRYAPDLYQAYPFVPDVTLSAYQVVIMGSADGHCTTPLGNDVTGILGVVNNAVASAQVAGSCDVLTGGVTKCIANGAITRGHSVIVATSAGDVKDVPPGTATPCQIVGTALESTTTTGDLVSVLLRGFAAPTVGVIKEVRCVADANIALTTALVAGQTIDGVTLVAGDRVLVANQTTAAASGVYLATAAGAASLAPDYAQGFVKAGMVFEVSEGTKWSASSWKITAAQVSVGGFITVGTTDPALYPRMDFATVAVGTPNSTMFIRSTSQPIAMNDTTGANAVKAVLVAGRKAGSITLTGTGTDSVVCGTFNW